MQPDIVIASHVPGALDTDPKVMATDSPASSYPAAIDQFG
jgi:hypothetical protein